MSEKYLRCPKCGKEDYWNKVNDTHSDYISMVVECPNCGKEYHKDYGIKIYSPIEKIIGRKLTWEDEPVMVEEE